MQQVRLGRLEQTSHEARVGILFGLHKVRVSERRVEDLGSLYVASRTYDVRTKPEVMERLRTQGRLVLLIDATQPDADGEALWVVLDHLSGEVLCGFTARDVDAEELGAKIRGGSIAS